MTIQPKTVVSLSYSLQIPDEEGTGEELIEQTTSDNPFVFLFGTGDLIEAFEKNLEGKKIGDTFDFVIEAKDGYGEYDHAKLADIPIESFYNEEGALDDEMVKIGNELPMTDSEGNRFFGVVEEVTETYVRMDFNHPLSGNDLHFTGHVLNVRPASEDEISHGHVHGEHGHQH